MRNYQVIYKNNSFSLNSSKLPDLKKNELAVELLYTGICGTDFQVVKNIRSVACDIIGHEGVGRVVSVGEFVLNYKVGDLVTFIPNSDKDQDEILGHTYDGLFQNVLIINVDVNKSLLCKMNGFKNIKLGPIIEPLASIIYSSELLRMKVDPTRLLIIGLGHIGLLACMFYKLKYPKIMVHVVHTNIHKYNWAIKEGIISPSISYLCDIDNLRVQNYHHLYDAAIVATSPDSTYSAFNFCKSLLGDGACLDLFAGFLDEKVPRKYYEIRKKNVNGKPKSGVYFSQKYQSRLFFVTGHRGVSFEHVSSAVELINDYPVYFEKIITHAISLGELPEFMSKLQGDTLDMMHGKIVINNRMVGKEQDLQ